MMVRALCDEVTDRLLRNPQRAVDVAKAVSTSTGAAETTVLFAIDGMKAAGWLIEIEGKLYVQRDDPPEAA